MRTLAVNVVVVAVGLVHLLLLLVVVVVVVVVVGGGGGNCGSPITDSTLKADNVGGARIGRAALSGFHVGCAWRGCSWHSQGLLEDASRAASRIFWVWPYAILCSSVAHASHRSTTFGFKRTLQVR
jgi:hypothetical protein